MSEPPRIDWNNLLDVQNEIHRWASGQFPHRTDFHALSKLVLHEIPELLTHKKEKGLVGIGLELADCFILLMDLARMWGIDLDDAIYEKMQINYHRQWVMDENGIMQHVPATLQLEQMAVEKVIPPPCPFCKMNDKTRIRTDEEREEDKATYGDNARCERCQITFIDDIPF